MTDNRATELLPCPFCGGEAETWDGAGLWHVVCAKCGTVGSPCLTEAEAIAAWNARAERTCKWEYPQSINGWVGYMVCSSCGQKYDETVTGEANYCPNCGAKVVDA